MHLRLPKVEGARASHTKINVEGKHKTEHIYEGEG